MRKKSIILGLVKILKVMVFEKLLNAQKKIYFIPGQYIRVQIQWVMSDS